MADCVVVALHGEVAAAVEELCSELERHWRLRRSHALGSPHLTLAIVHGPQHIDRLRSALTATAATWAPFPVTGAGYGVFVGHGLESPVLHLAVTRTPRLSALHEAVLGDVDAAGLDVDGQSLPEHWRPHLTLADTGVTPASAGDAMSFLVEQGPRHWTLEVDNVALLKADDEVAFWLPLH